MSGQPETLAGGLRIRRPAFLDESVAALLEDRNVCVVCTHAGDGTIHAQPVWVDVADGQVLLNTVPGRAWVRNLQRDGRVTCSVVNLHNSYESLEVRGRVVERTDVGAEEHIHKLARRYLGLTAYPFLAPDEPRMLIRIAPERNVHVLPEAASLES